MTRSKEARVKIRLRSREGILSDSFDALKAVRAPSPLWGKGCADAPLGRHIRKRMSLMGHSFPGVLTRSREVRVKIRLRRTPLWGAIYGNESP